MPVLCCRSQFIDYPTKIKASGKNGYGNVASQSTAKKEAPVRVVFKNIATKGEAETIKKKIAELGEVGKVIGPKSHIWLEKCLLIGADRHTEQRSILLYRETQLKAFVLY